MDKTHEISDLLDGYTNAFKILEAYDEGRLETSVYLNDNAIDVTIEESQKAIDKLKEQAINHVFFGKEKKTGVFKAILKGIHQSFAGKDIYPSIEEKAVNLFYLIIKNHPFADGNKRIAAAMFIIFLAKNKKLNNNMDPSKVASLALLVAESPPSQKDSVIGFLLIAAFD